MLNEIKIKIAGNEYRIKKSFGALILFEELSGRSVDKIKESVSDLLLLFYAILKANNKENFSYSFEEFINIIDEDPDSVEVFNDFLISEAEKNTESPNKKKAKNR